MTTHLTRCTVLLAAMTTWCWVPASGIRAAGAEEAAATKWWQRGQSGRVYMDDWRGEFLRGAREVRKTIEVPGNVQAAVIRFWSSRGGARLLVNGKEIPKDPNGGPIRHADITACIVRGRNTIELKNVGEVVAEGGVVLEGGREVPFATDESWAGGRRVQASRIRREGSRGYMGDYHVARPLAVTKDQKARFAVNQCNLARRRLGDDLQFELWRRRDPRQVLTLDKDSETREHRARIQALLTEARPGVERAEKLILADRPDEALKAVTPAAKKTEQALAIYTGLMKALAGREARRMADAMERAKSEARRYAHRQLNGSQVNRLGWVASCEPLDSDPAFWELDIAPPGAKTLGLAGLWWFRIDPKGRGLTSPGKIDFSEAGFQPIFAPTKWGWERWGYTSTDGGAGVNKPYNGLAWYGKRVVVPASWAGRDLLLRLGDRWGNNDWLAVNGTYVNPPETDKRGSNSGTFAIPAKLVRFGKENTLILRVYNHSNIGGIINPGLRLSAAGREPADLRSPVGPASVREQTFRTNDGDVTQILYSSALSPAVVMATTGKAIRLHGWSARGYAAPDLVAFMAGRDVKVQAIRPGRIVAPAELKENWLLLWSPKRGKDVPRPLLVVFEKRPQEIRWTGDAAEPAGLEIRYRTRGRRIGLVRPIDQPMGRRFMDAQLGDSQFWSRALLRYPVGYAEQVAFEGDTCKVRVDYEYVELKDDWGTQPLSLAPLPMLFSYALEHNWPGAKADGRIIDLGCRARSGYYPQMDCGTYRAAVGQTHVTYRFDRMEPKRHLRGVGTLGEERRIGQEMFVNLHEWGFNSSRPQIPFHSRGWDLFDAYVRGGPAEKANVKLGGKGVEFLDDMIAWHRRRNMTCVLNWFWDFGRGGYSDARGRQIERFWAAIAERYKDQPKWAVAYSILNEPAGLPWAVYDPFIRRVTRAIRAHDKVHTISIESGGGWAQPEDLDMTKPTGDTNTIYQYHFYGPHKTEFRDNPLYPRYNRSEDRWRSYEGWEERMLSPIRFQIRHRAEVFHGEFGISHLSAEGAAEGWLEDVLAIHHKYRMHWNWWHYSGSGTYRTGLAAPDHVNPLLAILRKYAAMTPPK